MHKRGQITVFIIVGMLLIGVTALIFFLTKITTITTLSAATPANSAASLKNYLTQCLEKTAQEGISLIGLQGGYYRVPKETLVGHFSFDTPVYFATPKAVPDIKSIEKELAVYIEENLGSCTKHFITFQEQGMQVVEGAKKAKINIRPGKIQVNLHYPLTIKQQTQETALEDFSATIPLDFFQFHSWVEETFAVQQESPESIPLGELMHLAYKNKYNLEVDNLNQNTVQYLFLFDQQTEDNTPFIFSYAIQYPWTEEDLK
ncbi:hypothetical protein HYX13_05105 [Candidatus Woesearchaeota archaeon]|nr:hypothetical protein [Candidatus Woesearchaeota archaeon]